MNSVIIFAFIAGAVATVNPCGFALLPAWFARQIAGKDGERGSRRFLRALLNGAGVTLGFVTIFSLAGAVLGSGVGWLGRALPYVGVLMGVVLFAMGIAALLGLRLRANGALDSCRRVNERFGSFGFGLSYGFISLSCTLPIFMSAVGVAFTGSTELAVFSLLAFLTGAGSVLAILSAIAALTGSGVFLAVGTHRGALRRAAGGLTAAAGFYVFFYWGQVLFGEVSWMRGVLSEGSYWSGTLMLWASSGAVPTILLLSLIAIFSVAWVLWLRNRSPEKQEA